MSSRWLTWRWTGVLLVAGMVLAGYRLVPWSGPALHEFRVESGCDLHAGSCRAVSMHGAGIELAISPREIPLLERLELTVALEGIEAAAVQVVFTGVDVDMGSLDYPLEGAQDGRYRGRASLSVCSQRRMTWKATVVVEADGIQYEVPFLFDTEYRSKFNFI